MPRLRYALAGAAVAAIVARRARAREQRTAERVAAAALEVLLNAVDANDRQTGAHLRRVAAYSLVLARAARLPAHLRRSIERVALFHDIGKISAALFDIVHDDGQLTPAERALVATHPERSADVLRPLAAFYPDLSDGVRAHHERWDGTGYPYGLAGAAIPITARVVAIADTFDAITHGRRYRRERSLAAARRAIREGRGTQFDPEFVDLFLLPHVFDEMRAMLRAMHAPTIRRHPAHVGGAASHAPDITFRWRSESLAPPPPGRSSRIPRESPPPRARPRA